MDRPNYYEIVDPVVYESGCGYRTRLQIFLLVLTQDTTGEVCVVNWMIRKSAPVIVRHRERL